MRARQIHRDLGVPVLVYKVLQLFRMTRGAVGGVMDEDIQPSEMLQGGLDRRLHV
ncbi:hypothetical protein D3C79_955500 [compost metagenome]